MMGAATNYLGPWSATTENELSLRKASSPLHTNAKASRKVPFAVIRDKLDTLVAALINLLDREFPKGLAAIPGLRPFLLVSMKTTQNTYEAIRYVAADLPKDPARKLAFGLLIDPLARVLADIIFTIVFMQEDLPARVGWYHRGGWRELKEDFDRHRAEYGALVEWQNWLQGYERAIESSRVTYGITEAEAGNLRNLRYWPTPGQILRSEELGEESRQFLTFLNDWIYRGLSSGAHVSGAGIVRRHGFLLLHRDERREEILGKLKSDGVFTATTLTVAISTEVNSICGYGRDSTLSYLWRILVEFWGEAKDLFDRRYSKLVVTKGT